MTDRLADLETHLVATADARLAEFFDFLRIPSVSTLPEHAPDMLAAADFLAGIMRRVGLEHVDVARTGGHPIVYGDWLHAAGAPTVLVYAHYDVQPAEPLDLWETPPFEPRVEGGRVYARGAADDKAQLHLHLAAAGAWLRVRGTLPVNLKYVFEGEEESGSESLDAWLADNRERLAADLLVVSDTGFFDGNLPSITVGLRGIVYAQVDVTGPTLDLHSGMHGGSVRNPANALASIIAGLHDAEGRVNVPGFHDDVRPLSDHERAELARLPFDDEAYRAMLGVPALWGEAGYSTVERRGARPTLDVNGIWGGFQGEGSKTIIPAHAHAKVSCRLVPEQDPARVFAALRERILDLAPSGVRVDVSLIHGARPSLTPMDHPATAAAAACLEEVFGRPPVYIREGGSVPVTASFESILGLPVVLLGFAPPDDNAHAPNESMRLDNYEGGLRTVIRYWQALADADPRRRDTRGPSGRLENPGRNA
jgi:acetylornithine deacetylase/succinyl-diaminopimelate desuccinylase-like protein